MGCDLFTEVIFDPGAFLLFQIDPHLPSLSQLGPFLFWNVTPAEDHIEGIIPAHRQRIELYALSWKPC
jgi:hypothetical protein